MPEALDDYGSLAVCDDPGQAMRAVAEKLGAHGFDVRCPCWEEGIVHDRQDGHEKAVA